MTFVLIAFLSFVIIASIGFVLTSGNSASDVAAKRAQAIVVSTPNARRKGGKAQTAKTPEERRKQILLQLKESERRDRKARLSLAARMLHAGLSPDVKKFWIISIAMGVFAALIGFLVSQNPFIALGAAFVFAYGIPRWFLGTLAKGRINKFTALFPDAMDILVRGIKSGLPVNDGLKIIAREMGKPLGPEFQRLNENVAIGMALDGALEKMCERMPTSELRFFTIVIAIQAKTGGNLAEALGNLSNVLRARRMMREKIKALSSEAIASASIIGVLPPGVGTMISLVNPGYIGPMFTDPRGNFMLMGGAIWMLLGILMMRKMINFKF
ncbi:type II secretion system F family protein [Asticcacaulis sp. BYS171W]|uniref:Type II secretion system F family protein n=1 Tax=Asticcacaulis aquaticus TaxID=2984212 RepID=A0ABT5HYL2_9CAUL|nr:type II secretion system F family protein [Asticcacaulis aquaticus]MDC7685167.1 type II secretion system F family protein [Asticcacaulis aquaticus]